MQPESDPLGKAFTPKPQPARPGRMGPPPAVSRAAELWPAVLALLGVGAVTGAFYAGTHRAPPASATAPVDVAAPAVPAGAMPAPGASPLEAPAAAPLSAPAAAPAPASTLEVTPVAELTAPARVIQASFSPGFTPAPEFAGRSGAPRAPAQPMVMPRLEPMGPVVDIEKEAHSSAFSAARPAGGGPAAPALAAPFKPNMSPSRALADSIAGRLVFAAQAQARSLRQGRLAPLPGAASAAVTALRGPDEEEITRSVRDLIPASGRSLTIYLAPWCGYCRKGLAQFRQMREDLRLQGVQTTIVVGSAPHDQLAAFAAEIGPGVVIDDQQRNPLRGVPAFFLADGGRVTSVHLGIFDSAAQGETWAASGR